MSIRHKHTATCDRCGDTDEAQNINVGSPGRYSSNHDQWTVPEGWLTVWPKPGNQRFDLCEPCAKRALETA